ncbi:hypothetical protein [Peribacillus loiseleuriae]|uniref:PsbP C-terminal domain-containing protein n=1 Tax=Peribacillus loiseleuriae TaxID=1679170 RepID=A0A0K9GRP1_9BACI|nr:hypothetical protein [Peribacillus loiseleuriae]KMY49271.1 hypothetical protein AC625_06825 [Peribacillus loiseleuriae]
MNKWKLVLAGLTVSAFVLSGCGTGNNDDNAKEPKLENTDVSTEITGNTSDTNENSSEANKDSTVNTDSTDNADPSTDEPTKVDGATETSTTEDKGETVRIPEQPLKFKVNGKEKEETAFLKKSDNQPFSLYVLPEFELTAEEPNKDVLYLTEQDEVYMRIEHFPTNVNWDEIEANVKTQLNAISETVTSIDASQYSLDHAVVYEAVNGDDIVTSVLFQDEKNQSRITIFTNKDHDYRDAFIQMGKSIMKN